MARPRKYDSDQARIAASRHRQAEAGAQLIQVRLTPPAIDALLRIIAGTGETKSAAVSRLLVEAETRKSKLRDGCIPWQAELNSISEKLHAARAVLDTHDTQAPNPPSSPGKGMGMRKRFEYVRMTAEEFRVDLKELDMPLSAFARIFGSHKDTVAKWYYGKEDIPMWVPVSLFVLKTHPGSIGAARQAAAERIRFDHSRPHLGEFPYLEREEPDDDDSD